jgi:hypothetical protein
VEGEEGVCMRSECGKQEHGARGFELICGFNISSEQGMSWEESWFIISTFLLFELREHFGTARYQQQRENYVVRLELIFPAAIFRDFSKLIWLWLFPTGFPHLK